MIAPGAEPWEVCTVRADADTLGESATDEVCRTTDRTAEPAPADTGCACGPA